ncbi:MAG: TonB-dependent receptor, partial [Gammaproteobacteria bacterium]|nr:TonB-dependent receptor [Gammaproteobacteria bacterium]
MQGLAVAAMVATGISTTQAAVLEEVVVTATKTEESLQDVNLAVTPVSGNVLEERQIDTVEDLQAIVPALSAGNDFAFAKIFIRGVGLNSSFAGVDPSVALHVDGAVVGLSYAQLGTFFDLERVEVLRGPQGTLYGRNATGGAVNLVTRKPSDEFEGYARFTAGNYDLIRTEGAISGPLLDNRVLGRVAVKTTDRDGYGINEFTGNDVDDANKKSIRGQLQFNFNEDVDLLLSAEWHDEDDSALGLKSPVEKAVFVDPGFAPAPGTGGFAQGDPRNINSELDNINERDSWAVTGTLNWRLTDNWRVQSITNWRESTVRLGQDIDWSSNVNNQWQDNRTTSEQFSQELQLHYDSDRLRGLLAFFYYDEDFTNRNQIGFGPGFGAFPNVNFTADVNIESIAVFGNVSWDITDSITLNFGGRYTDEERGGNTRRDILFFNILNAFQDEDSFDNFKPSVGIEWRPNDDMLTYFTYSEGFKGGAFQGGQITPILEPEEIDNYEIGFKGTFLDSRLQLNVAAFYYEVTNMQLDRTIEEPPGSGTLIGIFDNAAEAEGKGFEIESRFAVTENFSLDANLAYLDTEFTDYTSDNPLTFAREIIDLSGNSLRQAPEWTAFVRGEYDFMLGNGGALTFGAQASYKSEQFYTEFNDAITSQDDYTLVDLNLRYTAPNERLTVNLWGRNVTDELVRSTGYDNALGRTITYTYLPPATYGVTIGYDF